MWLLGFLLLPGIIAADSRELNIDSYIVKIVNDTLKSVEVTGKSASNELNLTGLGITKLDSGAFDNAINLTSLNLANNSIGTIRAGVFSKLTKLEYLSLADNAIVNDGGFSSPYANLRNLKILNLTNNGISDFRRHLFYGLSTSCDIITRGIYISEIGTPIFKDDSYFGAFRSDGDDYYDYYDTLESPQRCSGSKLKGYVTDNGSRRSIDANIRIKVCIENGTVNTLDRLIANETFATGCKEVEILRPGELHIRNMGIAGFARGWYKLQDLPISNIDLQDNDIARITPELLNDLPSSVRVLALQKNKIDRIEKEIIDNAHLSALVLRSNLISFVEDGAFEKLTTVENIFLDHNRLTDMKFAATLPTSLRQLYLGNNEITEIPASTLSRYKKLFNLELQNNKITKIEARSFSGLTSLEYLRLENNRLETIESGASRDLEALVVLDVSNNSIANVETGSLTGLDKICSLNFRYNKLIRFSRSTVSALPGTVENIFLDHNEIERLEAGTFVNIPTYTLTLHNNKIREIEHGTFNLTKITELNLNDNLLTVFDGDSFRGLPKLRNLMLGNNRIAELKKAGKYLGNLEALHIPNNPLKRMENGSLFGLRVSRFTDIHIANTPIELIQGGVFDDV